jgi:hypothetical protein
MASFTSDEYVLLVAPKGLDSGYKFDHRYMWYDAAHQHYIILKESTYYIWSIVDADPAPSVRYLDINTPTASLQNSIKLAKLSLDKQLIALQISSTKIVIIDLDHAKRWSIEIKTPEDNEILPMGLIWSEHGGNSEDLIIVTLKGLELYKVSSIRTQCKLSRVVTTSIREFWYNPNHRMILLKGTFKSKDISSINIASVDTSSSVDNKIGVYQMSGYYFRLDKTDHFPKLELPPPEKIPKFDIEKSINIIDLVTLYGKLYCCAVCKHLDETTYLSLYEISKAAVELTYQLQIEIVTIVSAFSVTSVSVCDNILLCHIVVDGNRSVLLYDILKGQTRKIQDYSYEIVKALIPPTVIRLPDYHAAAVQASEFNSLRDNLIYLSPAWLFHKDSGIVYRIRCNITSVSKKIPDDSTSISYLSRRGQQYALGRGELFEVSYDSIDAPIAKKLIIERIISAFNESLGLSWLEIIFKVLAIPCAEETKRLQVLADETASNDGTVTGNLNFARDNASGTKKESKYSISRFSSIWAGDQNKAEEGVSSNKSSPNKCSNALDSVSNYRIEPDNSNKIFLPLITALISQYDCDNMTSVAELIPQIPKVPLQVRRDSAGTLLVTQTELLSHVWFPLILNSMTNDASCEYYRWALSSFIACYRALGVPISPITSMLLLSVLTVKGKYMEVARLLQLQFFPDSTEIANIALEISGLIEKKKETNLTSLLSTVHTIRQVSLDMLWRLNEKVTVVRWLLGRGDIIDAITLCSKRKNQWRDGITPELISSTEFFVSAMYALRLMEGTDEGEKIELLYTVHRFICEWDKTSIARRIEKRKEFPSKLATQTFFPDNIFTNQHNAVFRKLFGFDGADGPSHA